MLQLSAKEAAENNAWEERIIEYPELEGNHKDHQIQLLESHVYSKIETMYLDALSKHFFQARHKHLFLNCMLTLLCCHKILQDMKDFA